MTDAKKTSSPIFSTLWHAKKNLDTWHSIVHLSQTSSFHICPANHFFYVFKIFVSLNQFHWLIHQSELTDTCRNFELFVLYLLFPGHQYFVGVQYHPEYISRPMKPSPPYLGLLLAATGKMQAYRSRGYRMSPHLSYSEGNEEDDEELAEIVRNISTEDVQEASSKDSSPNEES